MLNPNALREIEQKLARHLDREALKLQGEIKQVLREANPGRGRQYGGHRASAPGDPPATDTGRLINSIAWERESALVRRVGTNVEYAPGLEYGNRRVAPRPFMRVAVDRYRKAYR